MATVTNNTAPHPTRMWSYLNHPRPHPEQPPSPYAHVELPLLRKASRNVRRFLAHRVRYPSPLVRVGLTASRNQLLHPSTLVPGSLARFCAILPRRFACPVE